MLLKYIIPYIRDYGSLDFIYSYLGTKERNKNIENNQFRRFVLNDDKKGLWVCFLPWNISFESASKLNLIPKKKKVIVYEMPCGIINPVPKLSKKIMLNIVADLKNNIDLEQKFSVMGLSIGIYPAFYVANHFNVDKLVILAPGAYLGESLWEGVATQEVKRRAVNQGCLTFKEYDKEIRGTNPIENLDDLPKDIEIYISTNDNFIKTKFGEKVINKLNEKEKNPVVKYFKGKGHVLGLVEFGLKNNY